MKKYISFLAFFSFLSLVSCNAPSPEKYFDIAVLNTNMLNGFASDGMASELESPSVKMGKTKDEVIPMKRLEVVETKIALLEEDLSDIKGLKETPDTKDILQHSLALYNYVLPVYKNEYLQLATSYDAAVSKEETGSQLRTIHDKYYEHFNELYDKLINAGKSYAAKNSINVKWDVRTSPY